MISEDGGFRCKFEFNAPTQLEIKCKIGDVSFSRGYGVTLVSRLAERATRLLA